MLLSMPLFAYMLSPYVSDDAFADDLLPLALFSLRRRFRFLFADALLSSLLLDAAD